MDTTVMNLENDRTSEYHVLVLKLTDKLEEEVKRGQKRVASSSLSIYHTWKNIKSSYNNNKLSLLQHGVGNLNYQMGHIRYHIFKIIFSIFLKNILIIHQPEYM